LELLLIESPSPLQLRKFEGKRNDVRWGMGMGDVVRVNGSEGRRHDNGKNEKWKERDEKREMGYVKYDLNGSWGRAAG